MAANDIQSISEFLLHAGTNFRIVDLGRGMTLLDTQTFLDIENGLQPVPRPRQQHAWFGIVFWNGQSSAQHYIWFVKFPVDEQSKLISATRNHFLQIIVDALGQSLDDENNNTLPDNPYSFQPGQNQMAQFTALVKQTLHLPPSEGFALVQQYLQSPAITDWQQLSVQGIADLAVRLNDEGLSKQLASVFDQLAPAFQKALMEACESTALPETLQQLLLGQLQSEDAAHRLAALRGASVASADTGVAQAIQTYLTSSDVDVDTLSVIAARHYPQLTGTLLLEFLEQAALLDTKLGHQGALFAGLFSDLVHIPTLRAHVLAVLREPDRSQTLSMAIGQLFRQTQS